MLVGLALVASLLGGASAPSPRVFAVAWDASVERTALVEQADAALREELRRRGAHVVEARAAGGRAVVLKPSLVVQPASLELRVLGFRGADQALLGTISTRASGSTRAAQLKALVRRVCAEADALQSQ